MALQGPPTWREVGMRQVHIKFIQLVRLEDRHTIYLSSWSRDALEIQLHELFATLNIGTPKP